MPALSRSRTTVPVGADRDDAGRELEQLVGLVGEQLHRAGAGVPAGRLEPGLGPVGQVVDGQHHRAPPVVAQRQHGRVAGDSTSGAPQPSSGVSLRVRTSRSIQLSSDPGRAAGRRR